MKKHFRTRRQMITAVLLIIGILTLTVSVYANYDNASGYGSYKNALKELAFRSDNFTAKADITLEFDGEDLMFEKYNVQYKGKDGMVTRIERSNADEDSFIEERYLYDNSDIRVYPNEKVYSKYDYSNEYASENIAGIDPEDRQTQKLIRFMELSADLLIGDLKNNVVLVSKTDGIRDYSVDVSKNQMPEIVNAGISLLFGTANSMDHDVSESGGINYESLSDTEQMYFEKTGNKEIYDIYRNGWDIETIEKLYGSEEEFLEICEKVTSDMYREYEKILEEKYNSKGILLVKADGKTVHYDSELDYLNATKSKNDSWLILLGDEPYIENAKMTVKLDEKNRLIGNYIEGTMTGKDAEGNVHKAVIRINIDIKDYGKTVLDKFDDTGYTMN